MTIDQQLKLTLHGQLWLLEKQMQFLFAPDQANRRYGLGGGEKTLFA